MLPHTPTPKPVERPARATFLFHDNKPKGYRKVEVVLSAEQLAEHLLGDRQFTFYWERGWEPRLAAFRSLAINPPQPKAICMRHPTDTEWDALDKAIHTLHEQRASR